MKSDIRIVHNKLLGGWYVVRGPHQTPLNGRFNSKAEAQAWLNRGKKNPAKKYRHIKGYGSKTTMVSLALSAIKEDADKGNKKARDLLDFFYDNDITQQTKQNKYIQEYYRKKNPAKKSVRQLSVPEKHQLKIAYQTLKMSDAGAHIMGGPDKEEAREIIKRLTGKTIREKPTKKSVARDADLNAVRELILYIQNDPQLYKQQFIPIIKNLARKIAKGIYDPNKAEKLWKYLADNGARMYAEEYSMGTDWNKLFTVATRLKVSERLADQEYIKIMDGRYSIMLDAANIKLKKNHKSRSSYKRKRLKSARAFDARKNIVTKPKKNYRKYYFMFTIQNGKKYYYSKNKKWFDSDKKKAYRFVTEELALNMQRLAKDKYPMQEYFIE